MDLTTATAIAPQATAPQATAPQAIAPQAIALVDVEDLEDGDLAARLAEIGMPATAAPAPVGFVSATDLQAGVDAIIAAHTVARDARDAVGAHRLGATAAALVA